MTDRAVKVALIGARWTVVGHLPVWRAIPGVNVVAICTSHDESATAASRENHIPRAYFDYRRLLADEEFDIVDVGTRPNIRQSIVLDALAASKHVVTCNPFATDSAFSRAQRDLQTAQGVVGAIEAQMQWLPQFLYMRELIDAGYLGEVFGINLTCHFGLKSHGDATYPAITRPTGYPTEAGYTWLGQASSGASVVRNIGGHCLHGVVALFGEAESVMARTRIALQQWRFPDGSTFAPQTCDTAGAVLRLRSGVIVSLNLSWCTPSARGFSLEAWGSEGRLQAEAPGGFPDATTLRLFGARFACQGVSPEPERPLWIDRARELEIPQRLLHPPGSSAALAVPGRYRLAMFNLLSTLVAACHGEGQAKPDFRQAHHVHQICEAIETSSVTGRAVAVED